MSFHACLSAFILGTMFHYLMRKDPAEEALGMLLQEVGMFAGNWSLPTRLKTKLSDFIKFQHHKAGDSLISSLVVFPSFRLAHPLYPLTALLVPPFFLFEDFFGRSKREMRNFLQESSSYAYTSTTGLVYIHLHSTKVHGNSGDEFRRARS